MGGLLPSLTSIALFDSLSILPLCIVFLVVLLAGPRPVARSLSLLAGVFVVYLVCGVLVLLGLQRVFDELDAYAVRLWQSPYTEELIAQIVLGVVLIVFGWLLSARRNRPAPETPVVSTNASRAFLAGAGLSVVGLPGAVPYLAAIDLILRNELPTTPRLILLAYYNVVFVVPLVAIVGVRLAFGARADRPLGAIRRFLGRWGPGLVVALLMILGVVLVVDGIGWFLGHPLIPVE